MIKNIMIIISSVIVAMIVIFIGFSYAAFQTTATQQGQNVITTTNCLSIDIEAENDELDINGYPMEDRDGLNQTPYTFSITNNCNHYMQVDIGFEMASTSTLDPAQFKVALNKSGKGKINHGLFDDYGGGDSVNGGDARILLSTNFESNETKTYDYRMWIDYDQEIADVEDLALTGNIIVTGTIKTKPSGLACTDENHSTPVQGDEYVNGQYTYRYKQESSGGGPTPWQNISTNGWGVILTNKNSTDPVTTAVCATINGLPVVSMKAMFSGSQATSIDLSSFDTSNVTNMSGMFRQISATSLDLSNFDTSHVTHMNGMFMESSVTTLDLNSFDTSNVTDMTGMFQTNHVTSLDLRGFDTSNVTSMANMFASSAATTLDLSNFDTSSVTNMWSMFSYSHATSLDLSSFDTSNVTSMEYMFGGSYATSLDLSNFDTSHVTNMSGMFSFSAATSIDVSSFDTSNVTNMAAMFNGSNVSSLDLSSFDTSSVTNTQNMFQNATTTTGYARAQADADKFNASTNKPAGLTFVVKP